MKPSPVKPKSSIAHVEVSGTDGIGPSGAPINGVRLSFQGSGWSMSGVSSGVPNGFKNGGA
jgi:hypothetical protein